MEIPDTPAGRQLRWVLRDLATASDEEIAARLAPTLAAQLDPPTFRTEVARVGVTAVTSVAASSATELTVIVETATGRLALVIAVEPDEPHRIAGLLAQPAEMPPVPADWEEIDATLESVGDRRGYLAVALPGDGGPATETVVRRSGDAEPLLLGSGFKLFVLAAVADAIERGDLSWSDPLTIDASVKSLPSGELQDRPDGTVVTVQEAALLMISVSDNTATDLLIRALGRERIEQLLPNLGLGRESLDRMLPLLTTRELFVLKWGQGAPQLDRYASAGVEERRRILDDLAGASLPSVGAVAPDRPVAIEEVEWFATPDEMVRVHAWLDAAADRPGLGELREVLGTNPGVPVDGAVWPVVAYKGGSEPGVAFLSWLVHREDGRRYAVVTWASSTERPVAETAPALAGAGIIGQLASAP